MDSIKVYNKVDYGSIVTNEQQAQVMEDRRGVVSYYSSDPLRCKIVDVPKEMFVRIQRVTNAVTWRSEAPDGVQLEEMSAVRTTSGIGSELAEPTPWFQTLGPYLQATAEEWVGIPLTFEYVFGPRKYHRGAILLNHIDIRKYIVSATLTVDYDVEEPWPLTCELDDKVAEVYLKPGQMLLYEGRITPHARPKPLNGEYYINLYAHFYPAGMFE